MRFKLKPTRTFKKNLKRLTKVEQKMVRKTLEMLVTNPFYPSLRTKKVQGLEGLFSWEDGCSNYWAAS